MIEVVAPCSMEAGFTLVVTHGDRSFPVTVPEGGVQENQVFKVPYWRSERFLLLNGNSFYSNSDRSLVKAPAENTPLFLGGNMVAPNLTDSRWKDGLFHCCSLGVLHPSLWNAFCCPTILMAQVLTRLNMDWFGSQDKEAATASSLNRRRSWSSMSSNDSSTGNSSPTLNNYRELKWGCSGRRNTTTFQRIFLLTGFFWAFSLLLSPPISSLAQDMYTLYITGTWNRSPLYRLRLALLAGLIASFAVYTIVVLTKLRISLRRQDNISNCCGILEDTATSACCSCCSIAQLARHTADYEYQRQRAACCAPTGLGHAEFYSEAQLQHPAPVWQSTTPVKLNDSQEQKQEESHQHFYQLCSSL